MLGCRRVREVDSSSVTSRGLATTLALADRRPRDEEEDGAEGERRDDCPRVRFVPEVRAFFLRPVDSSVTELHAFVFEEMSSMNFVVLWLLRESRTGPPHSVNTAP